MNSDWKLWNVFERDRYRASVRARTEKEALTQYARRNGYAAFRYWFEDTPDVKEGDMRAKVAES